MPVAAPIPLSFQWCVSDPYLLGHLIFMSSSEPCRSGFTREGHDTELLPDRIPMRVIANAVDKLGPYWVLNDIRRYTAHAFFPTQRPILLPGLPNRPIANAGLVQGKTGSRLEPAHQVPSVTDFNSISQCT